jgi:hypothetical protein
MVYVILYCILYGIYGHIYTYYKYVIIVIMAFGVCRVELREPMHLCTCENRCTCVHHISYKYQSPNPLTQLFFSTRYF